jgi:hypothetical protein
VYNNVYNAGFYPQIGMSQGFAVNQVPPSLGHGAHLAHEGGEIKILTALEGLAALGGAAILYKGTKGKLHNVNTVAEQSTRASKRAAKNAERAAKAAKTTEESAKKTETNAASNTAKGDEEGFLTKAIKAPFKLLWAIITSPFKAAKGIYNWLAKETPAKQEVLQLGYEPSAKRAPLHADLESTSEAVIADAAQEGAEDATTVTLAAWKPEAK